MCSLVRCGRVGGLAGLCSAYSKVLPFRVLSRTRKVKHASPREARRKASLRVEGLQWRVHACVLECVCVFAEQQLRLGQETDWKKWWDLSQLQTKESKA